MPLEAHKSERVRQGRASYLTYELPHRAALKHSSHERYHRVREHNRQLHVDNPRLRLSLDNSQEKGPDGHFEQACCQDAVPCQP